MMKRYKMLSVLLTVLLLMSLTVTTLAAGNSLTIEYYWKQNPVAGAEFSVYHVATAESDGKFHNFIGKFDKYYEDLSTLSDSETRVLAEKLEDAVDHYKIKPVTKGLTNSKGQLTFDGLETGLYLVLGAECKYKDITLWCIPSLLIVPNTPVIQPKPDDGVDITVEKVWDDLKHEKERPLRIQVELLKNGKLYDEHVLSKYNDWDYTWKNLDPDADWDVREVEVENYRSKVRWSEKTHTFTITNTYVDTPKDKDVPTVKPKPPQTPGNRLPQTGQLWWPVPTLIVIGLSLIIVGLIRRRRSPYED